MTRVLVAVAAAAAVLCSIFALTLLSHHPDAPSRLSVPLTHGNVAVLSSSLALHHATISELAAIQALAASVTEDDARALSEHMFEKGKFSLYGSHGNGSSASFSTRKLRSKAGDKQFFVQFSSRADIYTLASLAKFSGQQMAAHVQDNLFVAIGSDSFASKARRFPGVAWVQERTPSDKISRVLKLHLRRLSQQSVSSDGSHIVDLIVQCWYDACGAAAVEIKPLCPVVYVHAQIIEVQCAADVLARAVSLLDSLVGIEHVEIKQLMETKNFAGRAILGSGPSASSPVQSRVLSTIDVSSSLIGVADTGINMNSCFFYDNGKTNNSRVVSQYSFLPCSMCGRCCTTLSPSGCSNATNACGNLIDENSHGTHVSGTIAGSSSASDVSAGNGISAGAKLYFQDILNALNVSSCYRSDSGKSLCAGLGTPSQLGNLFDPAYTAGVCGALPSPRSCASCFMRASCTALV